MRNGFESRDRSSRHRTPPIVGVGAVAVLLAVVVAGMCWPTVGAAGRGLRPSSTSTEPPRNRREQVVELDAIALFDQLVDLPDPLPTDGACHRLVGHPLTIALFDGATVTIEPESGILCGDSTEQAAGVPIGVSWYGSNLADGSQRTAQGSISWLLGPDGRPQPLMLVSVTIGDARYSWTPIDFEQPDGRYRLVGWNVPRGLAGVAGPVPTAAPTTTTTTVAPAVTGASATPSTGGSAVPAVPVTGDVAFTG